MDKSYRKRLLDLIRTDFITMSGGKNNVRIIIIAMSAFFGVLGFLFSPVMGLYVPLMASGFFVPMLFQNEMKYHSEKLFALLPIERKDLVRSRFLMSVGLYLAATLVFYLLMLLSLKLELWYLLGLEDVDILRILVQRSGGSMNVLDIFNLLYFSAFSLGLMLVSGNLRKYFNNSEAFAASYQGRIWKTGKIEKRYVILAIALILLVILGVTDILPLKAILAPVWQIILQLAQAANGALLGTVLIAIAVFSAIYKYICTLLEYDEKEL